MELIDQEDFTEDKFNSLKEEFFESIKFLANVFEVGTLFNKKIVDETKTATLNRSLFEIWTVLISNLLMKKKKRFIIIENYW